MYPEPEPYESEQKKIKKWPLIAAGAAVLLGIWIFSGSGEEQKKPSPAVPVKVTNVKKQDIPYYLSGVGTVESPHSAEIRTRVDGELVAIYFKEGDEVKKGAVIAEIDSRAIRADLAQARAERARANAELETAKQDAQRYSNLLKSDAIAKQTVDQQNARVKQLQAAWQAANAAIEANEVLLSYTKITSPVNGRIGIRRVDPGNIVKTSDPNGIVKVTQVKPINAIFSLSQTELPKIKKAVQESEVEVTAMQKAGGEPITTGKLKAIDNEIDNATGTIKLRAEFENAQNELWPGELIVITVKAGMHTDAMVIPARAVQRGRDGNFLYIVKDNKAEMVKVDVEYEDSEIAVITKGISFEDVIVTDGHSRLRPGAAVKLPQTKEADGKKQ